MSERKTYHLLHKETRKQMQEIPVNIFDNFLVHSFIFSFIQWSYKHLSSITKSIMVAEIDTMHNINYNVHLSRVTKEQKLMAQILKLMCRDIGKQSGNSSE